MLQLKQTLHNIYMTNSSIISTIMTEFQSLSAVPLNLAFQASLGTMLLSLMLLISIPMLMVVTFTSSLLLLLMMILKKSAELLMHIVNEASSVQYILCRLADVRKSITSMFEKLQKCVWREDGDSAQDSTYHYSEMHGGPKTVEKAKKHEQAFESPVFEKGYPSYEAVNRKEPEYDPDLEKRAR